MKPYRAPASLLALGLLFLLPPSTLASAAPSFYERILATGDAEDYTTGNRALDLDSLFIGETFKFDPVERTGTDVVTLRLTPTNLQDLKLCNTPNAGGHTVPVCRIRYDVYFESGGGPRHVNATFAWVERDDYRGPEAVSTNATVRSNQTSVFFVLPRADFGLVPGSSITRLWATSALDEEGRVTVQDRMPGNNANTPSDLHPEFVDRFAPEARMEGTYGFFEVHPKTSTLQRSVHGKEVRFVFDLKPTSGVSNDQLVILWETPDAWNIIPSRGGTAGTPIGRISDLSAGETMEFAFLARATNVVEVGQTYPIVMHVMSYSGGSQFIPVVVEVTDAHHDSTDHRFTLLSTGPLRAQRTETIRIGLTNAAGVSDLLGPVLVDFVQEGQRKATVPATVRDGAWDVGFAFPRPGSWTVDAYLGELEPSPHGEFTVHVESVKGSPGLGALFALAAALVGCAWFRVRD